MVNPLLIGKTSEVIENWDKCMDMEINLYDGMYVKDLSDIKTKFPLALEQTISGEEKAKYVFFHTIKCLHDNKIDLEQDIKDFVKEIDQDIERGEEYLTKLNQGIKEKMTEQESRIALKEKLTEIVTEIPRISVENGESIQDDLPSILKTFQEYLECFVGDTRYKQRLTPVKEQLKNQDLKAVATALIETKNLLKASKDRAGRVEILKKAEEKIVKIYHNLGVPPYEQVVAAMKAEEVQSLPTYDEAVQKAKSLLGFRNREYQRGM